MEPSGTDGTPYPPNQIPKRARSCSAPRDSEVKASNKQQKTRVEIPQHTTSEPAQSKSYMGNQKKKNNFPKYIQVGRAQKCKTSS